MSQPSVAVVILNWNGRKFIEQFLPSVLASTYANMKLVVADNASSDNSISFLKERYPGIEILISPLNEGFAKGYNTALKQVRADYYVLLNSDVEVTPGWIEPVIGLMESDKAIAACQPKILSYHNKKYFEYAGACGGYIDYLGYPFARGRVFDICEQDNGQYDSVEPVFWASGAALFVRAAVFHEMNGFDEFFFAHQEEIDLCWRMQLAGYKIYVQPASVVFHVGGGTLPRGNSRKTFLNFRNNHIMLWKNLPWREKCWKIPFRQLLDTISGGKALLHGDGAYFITIIRAHWGFVRWLFFHKKQSPFPQKRTAAPAGIVQRSIVWAYFIRGRKNFMAIVDGKT